VSLVEQCFQDPASGEACREYFERKHSSDGVLAQYREVFRQVAG
jgi:hypothetical protein